MKYKNVAIALIVVVGAVVTWSLLRADERPVLKLPEPPVTAQPVVSASCGSSATATATATATAPAPAASRHRKPPLRDAARPRRAG